MDNNKASYWEVFRHYLLINSTEEPTYLITRQHMGSLAAFLIAGYNTTLLKQRILKNAIHLTKSNKPYVVLPAAAGVGLMYYAGLVCVWHIPSFFAELAVRVYCASENATTTVLFRDFMQKELFSEKRLELILRKYS